MVDLPDISRLDGMNSLEKIRFMADLGAKKAKVFAELAKAKAEMKGVALQFGVALLGLKDDQLVWKGNRLECLMAERPEIEVDDEFEDEDEDEEDLEDDDDESQEDGPWPVNIEVDLLSRIRQENFGFDKLLHEHYRARMVDGEFVEATPGQLRSGEWFAV